MFSTHTNSMIIFFLLRGRLQKYSMHLLLWLLCHILKTHQLNRFSTIFFFLTSLKSFLRVSKWVRDTYRHRADRREQDTLPRQPSVVAASVWSFDPPGVCVSLPEPFNGFSRRHWHDLCHVWDTFFFLIYWPWQPLPPWPQHCPQPPLLQPLPPPPLPSRHASQLHLLQPQTHLCNDGVMATQRTNAPNTHTHTQWAETRQQHLCAGWLDGWNSCGELVTTLGSLRPEAALNRRLDGRRRTQLKVKGLS